LMYT